jgi:hypothetical protein
MSISEAMDKLIRLSCRYPDAWNYLNSTQSKYPTRTTQNHHFRSDRLIDMLCPACIWFELGWTQAGKCHLMKLRSRESQLSGVDRQDIAMGVRSFPVDRYVAYYEQHGPVLSVLRVWHTARDPETLSVAE